MWRNIGCVIAGLFVAMFLVGVIEFIGMKIVPPPPDIMSPDKAKQAAAIAALPTMSFVFVLIAWTIGSCAGSFTAAYICRGPRLALAAIIGVFIWLASLANLLTIPSPLFLWIGGLTLVPLACWAGAKAAIALNPSPPSGPQPFDMRQKNMACK